MQQPWWVRAYRIVFAVLIIVAIAYQFYANRDRSDFDAANFFSFFTIQSNIAAALLLIGATVYTDRHPSFTWDMIRGAAIMYMVTTGIVYGVLLAGISEALQTTEPWVNTTLHRIMPLVMVVDLLVLPLVHRISFRQSLVWTIYPTVYLIYSLLRGPQVDWYPYPFLDPDESGGYAGVAAYSAGILVGFLAFSALIAWMSGHLRLRIDDDVASRAPVPTGDA